MLCKDLDLMKFSKKKKNFKNMQFDICLMNKKIIIRIRALNRQTLTIKL